MRIAYFLIALLRALAGTVYGQAYPTKPVKIIVPYPPGGVTDLFARVLSQQLQEAMGQPFLLEDTARRRHTAGMMRRMIRFARR